MGEYLNLIVPCGISQLTNLDPKEMPSGYKSFLERLRNGPEEKQEEAYRSDDAKLFRLAVLEKIRRAKDDEVGSSRKWLGSELSTLKALQQREGNRSWRPAQDIVTLLRTDTWAGLYAAETVHLALVEHWQVIDDENFLRIVQVSGWKPNQTIIVAKSALGNLADAINGKLLESKKNSPDKYYNVLVATGGMRSTLPCLTIYSLLYGFEMVCLTEESDALLELQPAKAGAEKRIDWKSILHNQKGGVGSLLQSYIIKVLNFEKGDNEYW